MTFVKDNSLYGKIDVLIKDMTIDRDKRLVHVGHTMTTPLANLVLEGLVRILKFALSFLRNMRGFEIVWVPE